MTAFEPNADVWTPQIANDLTSGTRRGCAAVELDWVLFDADGVIQGVRQGRMEELTAWGGSRAEEFLLAIAAADVACLTGNDFGAAMRDVLRQFEISAPLEDVLDRQFWIEVRSPMLDVQCAVRDLGLHCGLATNQQNLRGTYMRNSLGFETIFDVQFYSSNLGLPSLRQGTFKRSWTASPLLRTGCCSSMIMMATSPAPARSESMASFPWMAAWPR